MSISISTSPLKVNSQITDPAMLGVLTMAHVTAGAASAPTSACPARLKPRRKLDLEGGRPLLWQWPQRRYIYLYVDTYMHMYIYIHMCVDMYIYICMYMLNLCCVMCTHIHRYKHLDTTSFN